jgi:hypothetical protein
MDDNNCIFILQTNGMIYKITSAGSISTIELSYTERLLEPTSIIYSSNRGLIISDTAHHVIKILQLNGNIVTSIVTYGCKNQSGYTDGSDHNNVRFHTPMGLCLDLNNNIIIADTGNYVIRMIDNEGIELYIYFYLF